MKSLWSPGRVLVERQGLQSLAEPLPAAGLPAICLMPLTPYSPGHSHADLSIDLTGLAEDEIMQVVRLVHRCCLIHSK